MTAISQSDRSLIDVWDLVELFTLEQERRLVAQAALDAALVVGGQLRPQAIKRFFDASRAASGPLSTDRAAGALGEATQ